MPFNSEYTDDVIRLCDERFGKNYITKSDLKSFINHGAKFTLALDEDKKLLALSMSYITDMGYASRYLSISAQEIKDVQGGDFPIGIIKFIVVARSAERLGLAHKLMDLEIENMKKGGAKFIWASLWKKGNVIPAKKIVEDYGFKYFKTVHNRLEDNHKYVCNFCHNVPCRCDDAIYYKMV